MKRLIRKSETTTLVELPQIGEDINIYDDPNYEGIDMGRLSLPANRDGAVLIDVQNSKLYLGTNGETHDQLLEEHFNVSKDDDRTNKEHDDYVALGVYLKNFLGHETIMLYSHIDGVEEVVKNNMPNVILYGENWDDEETLMRLAKNSNT